MRTLAHLSDLHFGKIDAQLLEPLRARLEHIAPDLLVISGDLTQRAKSGQFEQARAYLDTLPQPLLVVPGNHDVPLYNVVRRFVNPLKNYKAHITDDLSPFYADDEIAVAGVNTARSLTFKDGRINEEQVAVLRERFAQLDNSMTKIVVTHHPFDLPEGEDNDDLVWRAEMAMEAFAGCGADLLLSGHMHVSHAGNTADRYALHGYAALTIQAGTATSTRGRGETNSFNAIHIDGGSVELERYSWDEGAMDFCITSRMTFVQESGSWVEKKAVAA
ncbi:metallophosphoesterase [Caenimonas sp. SL110]|uniref:metallophosphoesterase family protein n=1 Tax=Caenimonas sp. SL110 TaxID=1450524 RepID=UPI00065497B6|nr:metallophosphoesterase [Caenimonas sp. SL110]